MPAPRNPHIRIGKIDLVGSVHLALSVDTVGRKARADLLYGQARSLYDDALTEAIGEVGCSGQGHLAGGAELTALKKRAEWSAASIAKTYNKDLLTMVEAAEADWVEGHGSKKGMTRLWLAKTVRPAIQERDAWKETQIGVTEQTWVNDRATQDFLNRNQIEGEIRVVPELAVCPICQDLVRRGWMKISESRGIFLPVHINCIAEGQRVSTPKGEVPIERISVGDEVYGVGGQPKVVSDRIEWPRLHRELVALTIRGKQVVATGEHPILTSSGWLPAQDVQVGMEAWLLD